MNPIVTLTMNPSIDVSWDIAEMVPVRKLRATPARRDPGGGGINVSRVIETLGGHSLAIYLAGGLTGHLLAGLIGELGMRSRLVPIAGTTRVAATAYETSTGHEYRIVPPGPDLEEAEWTDCLELLAGTAADYIVCTGSLPPGTPNDFYGRVASQAGEDGARVILDCAGRPLFEALEEGVYLVKPNERELEHLVGRKARGADDLRDMAEQLIAGGKAKVIAVSMGADGALVVWDGGARRLNSPKVDVRSAVGAGDSFVGGFTFGLADGRPLEDAFALAVACGAATVMTAGTQLCHHADVERLYADVRQQLA